MEIGNLRCFSAVFASQTGFRGASALVFANVLHERERGFARATALFALSKRALSSRKALAASRSSRVGTASPPNCRTVFRFA
jgi:hypothetical protein